MKLPDRDPILEAAARQFAEKGYGGARVDEIAVAAGVNKATLYYRIGDKAALYSAVLEEVLGRTAERITAAMAHAVGPEEKVRAYVREFAASAREHPCFAPIMMREMAGGGAYVTDGALRAMSRSVNALDEAVRKGIETDVFQNVNPFIAHMLVVGSVSFFNTSVPLRGRMAKSKGLHFQPKVDLTLEAMTEQLITMLLGALKNDKKSKAKKLGRTRPCPTGAIASNDSSSNSAT